MATLKVKKEYLDSEIHFGYNNSSYKVVLNIATQDQLKILKEMKDSEGKLTHAFDHIFEPDK